MRESLGRRYSAAVVRIEAAGRVRFERAYGTTTSTPGAPAIAVDARFDVASITKVFVATVALALVARGALTLDGSLIEFIPEWRGTAHEPITLRMILAHTAGFRSGADFRTLFDRNVEAFALTEALGAPPGERVVYSDLGFMALGVLLARATRRSLRTLTEATLADFGARAVAFVPPAREIAMIPATETDVWRGRVQGRVHDEKAALMNGVSGHAGLFADAADVARLAQWYLAAEHARPTPLDRELAAVAVAEAAGDPVLRRGLGWALKTTDENSCGTRVSAETFGHTGFTGTCVWADPERDCSIVLLTNAVHVGRTDIRAIRAAVCDAAIAELDR